jgi:hypothetical protein
VAGAAAGAVDEAAGVAVAELAGVVDEVVDELDGVTDVDVGAVEVLLGFVLEVEAVTFGFLVFFWMK